MTATISHTSYFPTAPIVEYVTRQWKSRFGYDEVPQWGAMVNDVYGDERALNVIGVKSMPDEMSWGCVDNFCIRVLGMHPANLYPNWFDVSIADATEKRKARRMEIRLEREERAASLAAKRRQSASSQAAANLSTHRDMV